LCPFPGRERERKKRGKNKKRQRQSTYTGHGQSRPVEQTLSHSIRRQKSLLNLKKLLLNNFFRDYPHISCQASGSNLSLSLSKFKNPIYISLSYDQTRLFFSLGTIPRIDVENAANFLSLQSRTSTLSLPVALDTHTHTHDSNQE
jgi:hypothetical protein